MQETSCMEASHYTDYHFVSSMKVELWSHVFHNTDRANGQRKHLDTLPDDHSLSLVKETNSSIKSPLPFSLSSTA